MATTAKTFSERRCRSGSANARAFLLTNKDRRRKYKHELTNDWITCRGNSFWYFCARSRGAALHARQSDRCHLSDTDGGKLGGARHCRRTLHLAVDTLVRPRRLRNALQDRSDGPHRAGIGHAKPRSDRRQLNRLMNLMAEMAPAGEDHREIAPVGGGNDLFVAN